MELGSQVAISHQLSFTECLILGELLSHERLHFIVSWIVRQSSQPGLHLPYLVEVEL